MPPNRNTEFMVRSSASVSQNAPVKSVELCQFTVPKDLPLHIKIQQAPAFRAPANYRVEWSCAHTLRIDSSVDSKD